MAITLTEKAANTSATSSPSAARAWACAWAYAPRGCSGMAYKLEFADEIGDGRHASSKAMA